MDDKKRTSPDAPANKLKAHRKDASPKRARLSPAPIKKPASTPSDAEMELLRALEEELAKEEEKTKQYKNKKLPQEEEDDDYDESDDE
ncbi:unnamed protein product [Phytophthora fragariaefolia]|uniref:Unnamed protein product n=1 Tax=Phytophthora fragariaefolia TaxID=1490495 RepID=A0A9W6YEP2_9STRA|nr:unnamed protein product [Phytophthora fragariaefolia]